MSVDSSDFTKPRFSRRSVIGDHRHSSSQYSASLSGNFASSTTSPAMPSATASSPSTVRFSIMNRMARSYPMAWGG